jgi:flagellar basal body-associated protein FliL
MMKIPITTIIVLAMLIMMVLMMVTMMVGSRRAPCGVKLEVTTEKRAARSARNTAPLAREENTVAGGNWERDYLSNSFE